MFKLSVSFPNFKFRGLAPYRVCPLPTIALKYENFFFRVWKLSVLLGVTAHNCGFFLFYSSLVPTSIYLKIASIQFALLIFYAKIQTLPLLFAQSPILNKSVFDKTLKLTTGSFKISQLHCRFTCERFPNLQNTNPFRIDIIRTKSYRLITLPRSRVYWAKYVIFVKWARLHSFLPQLFILQKKITSFHQKKLKKLEYFFTSKLFFNHFYANLALSSALRTDVFFLQKFKIETSDIIKLNTYTEGLRLANYFKWEYNPTNLFLSNPLIVSFLKKFNTFLTNDNFFQTFYNSIYQTLFCRLQPSYSCFYFNNWLRQNLTRLFLQKPSNRSLRFAKPRISVIFDNPGPLFKQPTASLCPRKQSPYLEINPCLSRLPHNIVSSRFQIFSSNLPFLSSITLNPLFFKTLLFKQLELLPPSRNSQSFLSSLITPFSQFFSSNGSHFGNSSNLLPNSNFFFLLTKKIMKLATYQKFSLQCTPWYFNTLVRFFEYSSGKKALLRFYNFANNILNFTEKSRCFLWSQKVKSFRRLLGPRLFLNESFQILYIALKNKDPLFLANWMANMFQKISFWKYKTFLRYLQYILRYFFWPVFKEIGLRGIKFRLKGKISVAGNARKRISTHQVGQASHATFNNRILTTLKLVPTFTGVLGLNIWIIF